MRYEERPRDDFDRLVALRDQYAAMTTGADRDHIDPKWNPTDYLNDSENRDWPDHPLVEFMGDHKEMVEEGWIHGDPDFITDAALNFLCDLNKEADPEC